MEEEDNQVSHQMACCSYLITHGSSHNKEREEFVPMQLPARHCSFSSKLA